MSFETKNDETQNTSINNFRGGLKVKQGGSGNEKGRVVRRVWFLSWISGYLMRGGGRKISLRPSGAAGEGRNHHSPPPIYIKYESSPNGHGSHGSINVVLSCTQISSVESVASVKLSSCNSNDTLGQLCLTFISENFKE